MPRENGPTTTPENFEALKARAKKNNTTGFDRSNFILLCRGCGAPLHPGLSNKQTPQALTGAIFFYCSPAIEPQVFLRLRARVRATNTRAKPISIVYEGFWLASKYVNL